jgi:hypothetical protein
MFFPRYLFFLSFFSFSHSRHSIKWRIYVFVINSIELTHNSDELIHTKTEW